MATIEARAGRRPRPWVIPPATSRPAGRLLDGADIISEIPGPLGVLLWLLHRDLELCIAVRPQSRGSLFRMSGLKAFEAVQLPAAVENQIHRVLDALVHCEPGQAAGCCAAISEWSSRHAPRTALLFAETAARASPESAALARTVGLRALACGLVPQGTSWLTRAAGMARRGRDWATYTHVHVDFGEAALGAQEFAQARIHLSRAVRAYRRYQGPRSIRARAALGLLRLALAEKDLGSVDERARHAIESYPRRDPRRSRVRIQVAAAYLAAGLHRRVLALLSEAEAERAGPWERAEGAALGIRAAASTGELDSIPERWRSFRDWAHLAAAAGAPADVTSTVRAVLDAVDPAAPPPWLGAILADAAQLTTAAGTRSPQPACLP